MNSEDKIEHESFFSDGSMASVAMAPVAYRDKF